jgi:hypothetical protein
MLPDVRCGWVREDGAEDTRFTKEDNSNLK